MRSSVERRFGRVQQAHTAQRRTHTFFRDPHETQEAVQARIRAKIARGDASPGDRFITFFWRAPEGEE
jgi:predicted DNA-binding WGR domain protein